MTKQEQQREEWARIYLETNAREGSVKERRTALYPLDDYLWKVILRYLTSGKFEADKADYNAIAAEVFEKLVISGPKNPNQQGQYIATICAWIKPVIYTTKSQFYTDRERVAEARTRLETTLPNEDGVHDPEIDFGRRNDIPVMLNEFLEFLSSRKRRRCLDLVKQMLEFPDMTAGERAKIMGTSNDNVYQITKRLRAEAALYTKKHGNIYLL